MTDSSTKTMPDYHHKNFYLEIIWNVNLYTVPRHVSLWTSVLADTVQWAQRPTEAATRHHVHTYLTNKFYFDALVLQPLPGVLQCHIHLPTHSFAIIEKKIFVFLPILGLVFSLLPRLGVIQDHIDLRALTKTEETHRNATSAWGQALNVTLLWMRSPREKKTQPANARLQK